MKELKIEAGKSYKTRDGRKVGIYRTDANHPEHSIHGYIIEQDGVEYSVVWRSDGRLFSTNDEPYDLISEWEEPLDFDWGVLPPWHNAYIAKSKSGVWYAYSNEPTLGPCCFHAYGSAISIPKEYQPKNFKGNWEDSLFKNPNLD